MCAAWYRPTLEKLQSIFSDLIRSSIHLRAFSPSCLIARPFLAPNFAESFSNEGFTLVLIWPPFFVLQPCPGTPDSKTTVERPPLIVWSAAFRPVYPEPTIATSTLREGRLVKSLNSGNPSNQ